MSFTFEIFTLAIQAGEIERAKGLAAVMTTEERLLAQTQLTGGAA